MKNQITIQTPTAQNPLLVGLLIDVSGSMSSAINNRSGESLNRLGAFEKALEDMAYQARTMITSAHTSSAIRLFAYGFGFGNPLASIFGRSGPEVRDLLQGAGPSNSLVAIEDLADNWREYQAHVKGLAIEMFGATPMLAGFEAARQRFISESHGKEYSGKVLFVLSDGDPTDGRSEDILKKSEALKDENILIVSCYVTSEDLTEPRVLYGDINDHWPSGAKLMFGCASVLPERSTFDTYLREKNWKIQSNGKLFSQINQSEILKEFIKLLLSPLDKKDQPDMISSNVFISYSHKDREWLDRLVINLKPLEREMRLSVWDDTKILAGSDWQQEIEEALKNAKVAILLISPDFLASEFIMNNELPILLEKAKNKGVIVIPVNIRSSRFKYMQSISRFQSINSPDKPLSALPDYEQDKILVDLTVQVEKAIERI